MGLLFFSSGTGAKTDTTTASKNKVSDELLYCRQKLEKWKDLPGSSKYQISDFGRVYIKPYKDTLGHKVGDRILKQRILTSKFGRKRYKQVVVTMPPKTNVIVARLILFTFRGPPKAGQTQARHLDSDSLNNALSNLAWGTYQENLEDKIAIGRSGKGSTNSRAKLNEQKVLEIRELCSDIVIGGRGGKSFYRKITIDDIAKRYGVSRTLIKMVRNKVAWSHV